MQLLLPVAVKAFVPKYIGRKYPVDPFVMTKTNEFGIYLIDCLSKPKLRKVKDTDSQGDDHPDAEYIDPELYPAKLKVQISENYWQKRGPIIYPEKVIDFNKYVQYLFNHEFYTYVNMRLGPKGSINKAIFEFRDLFEITEDELSFKTIQRAYQRKNVRGKACKSA